MRESRTSEPLWTWVRFPATPRIGDSAELSTLGRVFGLNAAA
jgi:hypothetical protein